MLKRNHFVAGSLSLLSDANTDPNHHTDPKNA